MPLLCHLAQERSLTELQFGQAAEKKTEQYITETVNISEYPIHMKHVFLALYFL